MKTSGCYPPYSMIIHCFTVIVILSLSANAFPQTETHPFILYTPNSVFSIRENITIEPYASWFQQELVEAESILQHTKWWADDSVPEETRAYYAKVLAFVYAFVDTSDVSAGNRAAWARESALGLYHIPSRYYKSNFSSDLTISEAALFWAEAYDILKGAGFDFSVDGYDNVESVIRSNMSALRDYMAKDYFVLFSSDKEIGSDFPSVAYFDGYADKLDNHHVKLYASLAVLALTVPEEDGSSEDFDHALTRLEEALNNMTITGDKEEPAGGWAEGPNYHLYSAHQYLAAVTALKNKEIADLYSDYPELVNTHLWLPRTVMPDGFSPPVDDNEAVIFDMAGLLYSHHPALPERDMFLWMWDTAGRVINKAFRADYIAQFDNTPPVYNNPEEMDWNASEFNSESGYARFRSSWNSDSVYLMLLCEHGEARENGQAHEHPDPNSIILHAFGEMLLLDSGYGGWGEHDATRFAENHNLILVNGEGPSAASQGLLGFWEANGSDAYLNDYFSSPQIDYAVSETIYKNLNTHFMRHVVFPGKRYFFIYDTVLSGTEVTYTLLLHGNGGGTSGGEFTQSENGAVWKHGEAALRTYTIGSVSPVQFDTTEMNHAVYNRSPMLTHTVLKASLSGKSAQYLTLLYPYPEGADIPDITEAPVINGKGIRLAAADTVEYGFLGLGEGVMTLDEGETVITADSGFLYYRVEKGDDLQHFFFIGGTFVSTPEDTLVMASHTVNLSVDYSHPSYIEGYVQANEETELIFYDVLPSRVLYCGNEISFSIEENNLIYTISGEGMFFIDLSEPAPSLEPPADVYVYDVPDDNGHSLFLEWSVSPSESEGLVDWYRIYRSGSDTFADPRPLTEFDSIGSLNLWEENYTVLIDSVAAGKSEYIDKFVPLNSVTYYYWVEAVGQGSVSEKAAAGTLTNVEIMPYRFSLSPPFPNPFNAVTTISYEIPAECHVELVIYDILGRVVVVLEDAYMGSGKHESVWDGKNKEGRPAGSGVYLFRLKAEWHTAFGKVMLLR